MPLAISSDVFNNRANATLYVPKGCYDAYANADCWKEFKIIVEWEELIGDANGDGIVNDADVDEITKYIFGNPSSKFIFKNADANEDNVVDVADIVKVNSILNSQTQ